MRDLLSNMSHYVKVYIDNILFIGNDSFDQHMEHVEQVIQQLEEKGMQINSNESHWAQHEVKYLGFVINRQGIEPDMKRIEALLKIVEAHTTKDVEKLVGAINFYHRMRSSRAHLLALLTALTKKGVKFL